GGDVNAALADAPAALDEATPLVRALRPPPDLLDAADRVARALGPGDAGTTPDLGALVASADRVAGAAADGARALGRSLDAAPPPRRRVGSPERPPRRSLEDARAVPARAGRGAGGLHPVGRVPLRRGAGARPSRRALHDGLNVRAGARPVSGPGRGRARARGLPVIDRRPLIGLALVLGAVAALAVGWLRPDPFRHDQTLRALFTDA